MLFRSLPAVDAAPLVTLAGAIFMAPFLILSALGGEIADRFDKAVVARRLKFAEVGAAAIAVVGLAFGSIATLMVALFAFGTISALFGPIKYGILPDHLETSDLPRANAWIEGATFAAILAGTILGGVASAGGVDVVVFGPLMMALALACWLASRAIPPTGAADGQLAIDANVFRSTWTLVGEIKADARVWRPALMTSWFWLVGAVMVSILPTLVKDTLGGEEFAVTAYLAVFAVAVAVGMAVGQAGAVVATAPTVVGVAVLEALVKVTRRLRTTMPPGRFGDVIATSITAVPEVEEVRTAKLARPPEVVVPQAGLVRIAEVPVDVTAYVAPDSGAFVQSAAVTVIAVSMPDWRVTGTAVATIAGALAEGLIPKVIPLASRSSSESSGPT